MSHPLFINSNVGNWMDDTRFGSCAARAIVRRIHTSGGGEQSWKLDFEEMSFDHELTVAEVHEAVDLLIATGNARVEVDRPGSPGAWLFLLTPGRLADDAKREAEQQEKAAKRAAKLALRGGQVRRAAIPDAIRTAVLDRDGHTCRRCGATEDLALDHIHPWSLGGPDTPDNLQVLCRPCNSRKGDQV